MPTVVTLRVQLLRISHQFVTGHGTSDWPMTVIVEIPEFQIRVRSVEPEWGQPIDPEDCPPIVRAIMEAVGPAPIPAKQLATKAGYEFNSHFRTQLADLTRNGFLTHTPDGYARADA